jgi:threonine dehydrogenase-like Zn-dependent dehydrogenase
LSSPFCGGELVSEPDESKARQQDRLAEIAECESGVTMGLRQQALVWTGNDLRVVTRVLPAPESSQIVLKLTSVGLCSSDFHIWNGRKRAKRGILGHEGAGEVISIGSEVKDWRPGDRAVVNPLVNCGTCEDCRAGRGQICPTRRIVGYDGAGLMATFQVLPFRSLVRHPPALPPCHACLVEPLACVVHAQRALDPIRPESTVLILGCGPMGALHAAYSRYQGTSTVLVADPVTDKLELARSRGIPADEWVPLPGVRERVSILTGGRGVDVAIIATSVRAGRDLAFELTAQGGQILAFASIIDEPGPIELPEGPFDSDEVHRREGRVSVRAHAGIVTVVGSIGFDESSFHEAARLLSGPINGEQFVTARVAFEDVPALVAGDWQRHLKIVILPSGHQGARSGIGNLSNGKT